MHYQDPVPSITVRIHQADRLRLHQMARKIGNHHVMSTSTAIHELVQWARSKGL